MGKNIHLTITIVSWNTRELTHNCLKSLLTEKVKEIAEIHVVDNNSHDGSAEMIRQEFPEVRLFANKENVGFARANNQSWREARGRYWLLLNSDTIVKDGAVEKLIEFMDSHPKAGMASSKLLNPDKTIQYCAQREPSVFTILLEFSRLHKLLPPKLRGDLLLSTYFSYNYPQKMDWAWGTALIVRREAIEEGGALSENFFMYGEDMEWSLRLRKYGWEVWICPDSEIIHYGGQSTQQSWDNTKKQTVILDNCYEALKMHRSRFHVKSVQLASLFVSSMEFLMSKLTRHYSWAKHQKFLANYYLRKIFNVTS